LWLRPAAKQAQAAAPPQTKLAPPAVTTKEREKSAKEAPKDKPKEQARDLELSKALATPIKFGGFDDPKTTLIEALDALARDYHITIHVNERAFKYEQVNDVLKTEIAQPNPVPGMNARLGTVLKIILGRVPVPSGATFLIREDYIEITTQYAARVEMGIKSENPLALDGPVPPEGLPPLVWEDFEEQPLKLALRSVSNNTGWNIVLDPRAGEKAQTAVTARLMNVPADTAVRILADMGDLQVVRLDNVLYVTTPQNAARLQAQQNQRERGKGMGGVLEPRKGGGQYPGAIAPGKKAAQEWFEPRRGDTGGGTRPLCRPSGAQSLCCRPCSRGFRPWLLTAAPPGLQGGRPCKSETGRRV
jgi:hypothetical protein